jgi:hypothetical protein
MNEYFNYYNMERTHSGIDDNHPEEIYFSMKQKQNHATAA